MQAYEHILASILNLKEDAKKEEILEFIKRYSAYMTLPDSIRGAVNKYFGKAYRQPSHFSEGAYMKYVEILRGLKDIDEKGFPEGSIYIPEGLETKAADSPTNLEYVRQHNQGLMDSKEGQFVVYHLIQDTYSDKLFQGHIATCYTKDEENSNGPVFELYGVKVKDATAKLNQTNRIISMSEFREIVVLVQKLSTFELYRRLNAKNKNITFGDIKEAAVESYDDNYPECMKNAKKYVVPSEEEQTMILDAIAGKDSGVQYYNDIKRQLVERGAFKSVKDIEETIETYIAETGFESSRVKSNANPSQLEFN